MTRIALQFAAKIAVLLVFAVPIGMFIRASGTFSPSARATTAGNWHPTQPPLALAGAGNVGWALNGHKPTPAQVKMLILTGALAEPPVPPSPLPPSLTLVPTAGWTLDNGAMITTDSNDALVLRPLTSGRPSLPGQGQGWRAAYYYPERTSRWQNYTLGVTVTNLGAQGFGGDATVLVGYSTTLGGYAVTISTARITVQNREGTHIYSAIIPDATSHRMVVKLTDQLSVTIDGSPVATFPIGHVQGGIGFGVWKAHARDHLPFFTRLQVNRS
jgi:hypothetical protein